MTTVAFLLDAVSGSPSNTGASVRQALSMYLPGASSARPLGSTSGVRVGTPTDTISVSGSTVTIKPHSGVLDKHTSATAGPYLYAVTANETKTLDAAHATYARIDIITVKVDDPAQSDGSSVPAVVIGYKAGTASASPTAPTPDSTREMVLANINVPASGGGSATVTWKAPIVSAAGAPYYWLSQAQQDAQTGMVTGEMGLRADNGITYRYSGSAWAPWSSAWTAFTPTLYNMAIGTGGSALNSSEYKYTDGEYHQRGRIVFGSSGATYPSGPAVGLPSGIALRSPLIAVEMIMGSVTLFDAGVAVYRGYCAYDGTNTDRVRIVQNAATASGVASISTTSPFTWGAGDAMAYEFIGKMP